MVVVVGIAQCKQLHIAKTPLSGVFVHLRRFSLRPNSCPPSITNASDYTPHLFLEILYPKIHVCREHFALVGVATQISSLQTI